MTEAIERERQLLEPIRAAADLVVDTTDLTIHQLRARLTEVFGEDAPRAGVQIVLQSFGFKHGLPLDVEFVFDCPCSGGDEGAARWLLGLEGEPPPGEDWII